MSATVTTMTSADLVASNAALRAEVQRSQHDLKLAQLTIEKMKVELAYLRRMKYGRSSEKLEHAQLELVGGQAVQPAVAPAAAAAKDDDSRQRTQETLDRLRELEGTLGAA